MEKQIGKLKALEPFLNSKGQVILKQEQIRDLISKMPKNRGELHCVPGFDGAKGNKYGNDILEIIRRA